MTTLFHDTFSTSSALQGRVPDVGPAWSVDSRGSSTGAGLVGTLSGTTYRFDGEFTLPAPNDYTAMTIRARYSISNTTQLDLLPAFRFNPVRSIFELSYRTGADPLVGYTGLAEPSALVRPGTNEIIQTMNFVTMQAATYVNGELALFGPLPPYTGEEEPYVPNPALDIRLGVASYGPFGTSTPLALTLLELEVTDTEYAPEVGDFWTNLIRAGETP